MLTTESAPARSITVDLFTQQAGEGLWKCQAHTPEGALLVVTPECDSEEAAQRIARAMWRSGELVLPVGCEVYGHA